MVHLSLIGTSHFNCNIYNKSSDSSIKLNRMSVRWIKTLGIISTHFWYFGFNMLHTIIINCRIYLIYDIYDKYDKLQYISHFYLAKMNGWTIREEKALYHYITKYIRKNKRINWNCIDQHIINKDINQCISKYYRMIKTSKWIF